MSKKTYLVKIEKTKNNKFIVHKNVNFDFLIQTCYEFYESLIASMQKQDQIEYVESKIFKLLLKKIRGKQKTLLLTYKELIKIKIWVDGIVISVVESDAGIDLKGWVMIRFLKTAETFIAEINKNITDKELQNETN